MYDKKIYSNYENEKLQENSYSIEKEIIYEDNKENCDNYSQIITNDSDTTHGSTKTEENTNTDYATSNADFNNQISSNIDSPKYEEQSQPIQENASTVKTDDKENISEKSIVEEGEVPGARRERIISDTADDSQDKMNNAIQWLVNEINSKDIYNYFKNFSKIGTSLDSTGTNTGKIVNKLMIANFIISSNDKYSWKILKEENGYNIYLTNNDISQLNPGTIIKSKEYYTINNQYENVNVQVIKKIKKQISLLML